MASIDVDQVPTGRAEMRLPQRPANPSLAVLIQAGGFASLDRFAEVVNARAWRMHGVRLTYDHVSVKRWIHGGTCQFPDVVAAVLADAWGLPVPVGVVWPELRDGAGPVPAHRQPWVSDRTLHELDMFTRSDMLTRRQILAASISLVAGSELTEPIARWLPADATHLINPSPGDAGRVNQTTLAGIEQATRRLTAEDAGNGGGLSREAAVGQLKYAVDLARHARYDDAVGHRLLAAVGKLADVVGWMSHDVGMNGPAQRYFVYGLQAAAESDDGRAPLVRAGLLADMARQMRSVGRPDTGLRLVELGLEEIPRRRADLASVRALLWNLRGRMLAAMGAGNLSEVESAIALAFDLNANAPSRHDEEWRQDLFPYLSLAELASEAAGSYRDMASERPELAAKAEEYASSALSQRIGDFDRSQVFDQIGLARARFLRREPEQACEDADTAIDLAARIASSRRVTARLTELLTDSEPYADSSRVGELRTRLRTVVTAA